MWLRCWGSASLVAFGWLSLCPLGQAAFAEPLRIVQEVDPEDGIGAPFPPESGVQLELHPDGQASLDWKRGRRGPDAGPVSFDRDARGARRVFALDPVTGDLLVVRIAAGGVSSELYRFGELAGLDPGGLAVDADGDRLFVLDAERQRILRIDGFLESDRRELAELPLPGQLPPLRGLARHGRSGHLYALAPATRELLELSPEGALVDAHELPDRVGDVRAIAIAPSSDTTDDPWTETLFAASASTAGGTTYELALEPIELAAASTIRPDWVQVVDTSQFSPPSPDPAGVDLLGPDGPLLVSDSEVNEMSIYQDVNLFEVTLGGSLVDTSDTSFFSNEPTGVARNPADGHLFFSDDSGTRSIYEVTPGSDGRVDPGDPVRQIVFASSVDAEGVAIGGGSLWLADGSNNEVWRIQPGPNGIFENAGDDTVTSFDVAGLGLLDPEGITYDTDGGHLYLVGKPEDRIAHVTTDGTLLRWLDIGAANPDKPAGLAYGPAPAGSPKRRIYLVARGVDNNSDPNENDGRLYVFEVDPLPGGPGNQPPQVSAGPDQAIDLAESATLDGSASDDGLPGGTLTTDWTRISGPGSVDFADPAAAATTASFSAAGTYVLRLTADDGELMAADDVTITVTDAGSGGTSTIDVRVATGGDDAEEASDGSVGLSSSDLELIQESSPQTVGIRFRELPIPPGAGITSAWIQFQADETDSVATTLAIEAEASADAAPFTTGTHNVSARPRTPVSVLWTPPPWDRTGEAGAAQRTPDLSAVVQQVVSGGGWAAGNAMVFIVTGSGKRVAESYNGVSSAAPLLHVTYVDASENTPPTVTITGPADGASFPEGDPVQLGASADDAEDGDLTADLVWTSSLDGPLGSGSPLTTTLAPGSHTITASVTDSGGLPGSDAIGLTVDAAPNTPPTVTITGPADGSSFSQGDPVQLSATASDAEDGDLTADVTWTSSLDGSLGSGSPLALTSLSAGSHVITADVTDTGGLGHADAIGLSVDGLPAVAITAPADGASLTQGQVTSFTATALDPEDGDVSGSIVWESNKEGVLGTGASIGVALQRPGRHEVSATATDASGGRSSAAISVRVRK